MKKIGLLFWFFIVLVLSNACKSEPQIESRAVETQHMIDEALLKTNRFIVRRDQDHIANYVRRWQLNMKKTDTGIWYLICSDGGKRNLREGDLVNYTLNLQLIDGTVLDSASFQSPRQLRLGANRTESGLEEMMSMLGKGDKAKFILPPYLAYGNFGDPEKNIPPGAILIYEIEILNDKTE